MIKRVFSLFFFVFSLLICAQSRSDTANKNDSLLQVLKISKNIQNQIIILNKIGNNYYSSGRYLIASQNFEKAYQLCEKETDSILIANTLFYLGNVYDDLGKYEKAISKMLKAYTIYTSIDALKKVSQALNALSVTHIRLKDYNKAMEYSAQAMQVSMKINDTLGLIKAKKHSAIIYKKLKKYKKSIKNNLEVAKYELQKMKFSSLAKTYNNLGTVYAKIKKYDSSFYFQKKSFELKKAYGNKRDIVNAHLSYGNLYYNTNNLLLSKNHIRKAVEIAREENLPYELMNSLQSLAVVCYDKKEYKDAFNAMENYTQLSDSLTNLRVKSNIAKLETKYQTKQKESKILKLTNENLLKEKKINRFRNMIFFIVSLILIATFFTFFIWQRRKQKQKLALLETTVKASENEKKRIGKELHDGIAGKLIKLVHDTEKKDLSLADQLLNTYHEVRNLSHQLDNSPSHGELFMERLIDVIPQGDEDQKFSFTIKPMHLELYEPFGTHIYRIVQELISNNLKHANAHNTKIDILYNENILSLKYQDDGIGIKKLKKGNGFKNIEDRIALMKGGLKIDLNLKKGVMIKITIPFEINENL
jgi:signal transduction histidine kinase